MPKRWNQSTECLSDIEIRRGYDVICNEHGVIDSPPTYAAAIRVRREHWETHPDHRSGKEKGA